MLKENQTVHTNWSSRNKKRYISLGYTFTDIGDDIYVKPEDLSNGSNATVIVICDYCGKEVEKEYYKYIKQHDNVLGDCCKECRTVKMQSTSMKRYGCKNPSSSKVVREKVKQSYLERYGVEHPMMLESIKEKLKDTNNRIYGCDNPFSNEDVKEKIYNTNMNRFGCKSPMQNKSVLEKAQNTNLERYGSKILMQNDDIKNKVLQKMIENRTYATSNIESELVKRLIDIYGEDKCFPQYLFSRCIFDCLLIIDGVKIDIEYDGWHWHKDSEDHDNKRNHYVMDNGFKVLRFQSKYALPTNDQILESVDCLVTTDKKLKIVKLDI